MRANQNGLRSSATRPRVEEFAERRDVRPAGAAAQRHQLYRLRCVTDPPALQPERQQRVLQQRHNRHRIAGSEHCFEHEPEQRCRRRVGERRAAGVVGAHVEAQQFGRDAPRQLAVTGDQRGLAAGFFHRLPERDGDGRRLVAFARRFNQRHAGERRVDVGCAETGPSAGPFICGLGRAKGFRHKPRALLCGLIRLADLLDVGAQNADLGDELRQTVLRMAEHGGFRCEGPSAPTRTARPSLCPARAARQRR